MAHEFNMGIAFAKFAGIAVLAAFGVCVPWIVFGITEGSYFSWLGILFFALPGSLIIGLPLAFATFALARDWLAGSVLRIFLIANLAAGALAALLFSWGGYFGLVYFGGSVWIAANVYAALGWLWVLKPMVAAQNVGISAQDPIEGADG